MENIKNYVVDTNVIVSNPKFLESCSNCNIFIPIYVLEELDKIKSREGLSGFNVRQFFRYLKELEKNEDFFKGVVLPNNTTLFYSTISVSKNLPEEFDLSYGDNRILSIMLNPFHKGHILVTNDVSFRVKAKILGIEAIEFWKNNRSGIEELYSGAVTTSVTSEAVKKFFSTGEISLKEVGAGSMFPNQFFYGAGEFAYEKILGKYDVKKDKIVRLQYEDYSAFGVRAKDIRQKFAMEALLSPEIPFVTISSRQGCGKTLLAVAAALSQVLEKNSYDKILIGKNTAPIDKWSYQGFTTGATEEKLITHFGNYTTTIENIQLIRGKGNKNGMEIIESLKEKNKLDILDISSILGSSFSNKIIIIDEAQSFDINAMRSIITRVGENSKMILIGDLKQQTISSIDPDKSGFYAAIEWLKELEESAHITLEEVHRSSFVDKASKIFDKNIFM